VGELAVSEGSACLCIVHARLAPFASLHQPPQHLSQAVRSFPTLHCRCAAPCPPATHSHQLRRRLSPQPTRRGQRELRARRQLKTQRGRCAMLLMPAKSVSTCRAHRAHRVAPRRVARAVHASSSQHAKATGATQQLALPRRELLTSLGAVATLVLGACGPPRRA
jgi:hypothetical protein